MKMLLLIVFALFGATPASAQGPTSGLRGDAVATLEDARNKIVSLAGAIDDLDWRPGEGVRSVREVVAHVAGANYYFGRMLGTDVPDGVDPRAFESMTDRDALISALTASFDHVESVLRDMSDEQLSASTQWFDGSEKSNGFVVHFVPIHAHEHLGQLIAYARMNQVTPPWSQ